MHYALPIAAIALVIPLFFAVGRGGFSSFGWPQIVLRVLMAAALLGAAAEHFLHPDTFVAIIPPVFPFRFALVVISGFFEFAGAIGLFPASTRRAAAVCIALLMVVVFPANVYVAGRTLGNLQMPGIAVRATMQIIFIVLVLLAGWGIPRRRKPVEG